MGKALVQAADLGLIPGSLMVSPPPPRALPRVIPEYSHVQKLTTIKKEKDFRNSKQCDHTKNKQTNKSPVRSHSYQITGRVLALYVYFNLQHPTWSQEIHQASF